MPDPEALVESRSCKLNKFSQIVAIKLAMYVALCAVANVGVASGSLIESSGT